MSTDGTGLHAIEGTGLRYADVGIYALNCDFLLPFLEPAGRFVSDIEAADFVLAMNSSAPDAVQTLADVRRFGKPIAWWSIEDPNAFEIFLAQAAQADYVFTTDEACVSSYHNRLGHARVFGLPLACSPSIHRPLGLDADASDFVLSANWYHNEARLWSVETVVQPLVQAGYSLTLFCYTSFLWPPPYDRYWRGETSYLTVAEQYRRGRVVLGINNQRSGMDGRLHTYMTSMRTFEGLACEKPLLGAYSEAYERLGFINGEHMLWVDNPADALSWAERLLGTEGTHMAQAGRRFVLTKHTYAHRLFQIAETVLG